MDNTHQCHQVGAAVVARAIRWQWILYWWKLGLCVYCAMQNEKKRERNMKRDSNPLTIQRNCQINILLWLWIKTLEHDLMWQAFPYCSSIIENSGLWFWSPGKNLISEDFVAEARIALLNHYERWQGERTLIIITERPCSTSSSSTKTHPGYPTYPPPPPHHHHHHSLVWHYMTF